MIQALRSGILILIVPPTFVSVGMIFVVYNKRNQVRRDENAPGADNWDDQAASSDSGPCRNKTGSNPSGPPDT
jgi:hypothetical protein